MPLFVDLAFRRRIPRKNDGLFTFRVPESLQTVGEDGHPRLHQHLQKGSIVLAPFQGEIERAVVVNVHSEEPLFETEEIKDVCTPPLLGEKEFALAREISDQNMLPLASMIPLFLPQKIFSGTGDIPVDVWVRKEEPNKKQRIGKKMAAVLEYIQSHEGEDGYPHLLNDVREATEANMTVIHSLQEKELISLKEVPLAEHPIASNLPEIELSEEQQKVFNDLLNSADLLSLLFAPTGSGKSHLLRAMARYYLRKGKSSLFIVPEIGLTSELVKKCNEIFGHQHVAVFHSRLSEGQKALCYWRIKTGNAKIIIGSRAALFLPFSHLAFIALEEEHEWSLKSDQTPRYHGKDVAEALANIHNAKLVFSSATPSLETYIRTKNGDFPLYTIPSRNPFPKISLIDLREEQMAKNPLPISPPLIAKMNEVLKNGKQILLFLNRRGFHRALLCEDCGETSRCPDCNIGLVLHTGNGRSFLLCHYCGKVYGVPQKCSYCGGSKLRFFGGGTAKIESLLQQVFPQRIILRIDRDTTSKKAAFSELHEQFSSGKADILVGTQIIAKGLDFENIGLVGALDADAGLNIPDFRAAERTFQLLLQVAGRAGRRGQVAEVFMQTRVPEHPLFSSLIKGDVLEFLEKELQVRETFFLPPYSRIAKLIFVTRTKEQSFQKARDAEKMLQMIAEQKFPDEKVEISVAPALIPKKHGKFYVNLILTAKDPKEILRAAPLSGYRLDVDPVDTVG